MYVHVIEEALLDGAWYVVRKMQTVGLVLSSLPLFNPKKKDAGTTGLTELAKPEA